MLPVGAAAYFGYDDAGQGRPVKAALIGGGDEGGVLVGEHNPEFLEFVAVCDIRPTNHEAHLRRRAEAGSPRKGFNKHLRQGRRRKKIKKYDDYRQAARQDNRTSRRSSSPCRLHLHAPVAIDCHARPASTSCARS